MALAFAALVCYSHPPIPFDLFPPPKALLHGILIGQATGSGQNKSLHHQAISIWLPFLSWIPLIHKQCLVPPPLEFSCPIAWTLFPLYHSCCSVALDFHFATLHHSPHTRTSDSTSLNPSLPQPSNTDSERLALLCDDWTWVFFLFDRDLLDLTTWRLGPFDSCALQSDNSAATPAFNGTPNTFGASSTSLHNDRLCRRSVMFCVDCFCVFEVVLLLFLASPALTLDLVCLLSRPLFTSAAVTHPAHATGSLRHLTWTPP